MSDDQHPLDLGLLQTSECDEVWEDEMKRHDGLIALRKAVVCNDPTCHHTAREHFQAVLGELPQGELLELMEIMAPHVQEEHEALWERVMAFGMERQQGLLEAFRPFSGSAFLDLLLLEIGTPPTRH